MISILSCLSYALFFVFILSSMGQLGYLGGLGGSRFYLFDLAALTYLVIGFFVLIALKSIKIPRYIIPLLWFVLIALISLFLNLHGLTPGQFLSSAFYLARFVIYLLVGLVTYNLVQVDAAQRNKIIVWMIISAVILSISGLVQLIFLPDFRALPSELGWDPHINRLSGTFFDPNFAGGYLVSSFVLLICVIPVLTNWKAAMSSYLLAGVILSSAFLTFSRSSWLTLSVAVLLFSLFRSKKLIYIFLVLIFLTYYLVPRVQTRLSGVTDPSDSAKLRLISWSNTYKIAKDNLALGVGFNTFRFAQERYGFFDYRDETGGHAGSGSDSSLLLTLATTGVFGLISMLAFFYEVISSSLKNYLRSKSGLHLATFITFSVLLVHSQFVNSLYYPQFMLWYFVLAAVSYEDGN